MGRLFVITLSGQIYSCKHCHTHFALADDILSRIIPFGESSICLRTNLVLGANALGDHNFESFQSHHGKAYLFDKVVNVTIGEKEGRTMTTGMHIVCDIFCVGCGSLVGWKYEAAHEEEQKYKEGKFILERFKVIGPDGSGYIIDEDAMVGGSEGDD